MALRTAAVLFFISTTALSMEPPGQCIRREELPFLKEQRCSVTVNKGFLNALCNILLWKHYTNGIRDDHVFNKNVLLLKLELKSEEPVENMTLNNQPVCLSLTKIWVEKLDNFEGNRHNYREFDADGLFFGPLAATLIFDYIQLMTFHTTFSKPPHVAAAVCNEIRHHDSCLFGVYGFRHTSYNATSPFEFYQQWNIDLSLTDTLNITFSEAPNYDYPLDLLLLLCFAPVKKILWHKGKVEPILAFLISCIEETESISFIQSPIQEIAPHAFVRAPNITSISFVDTRLSGIPEAIFELRHLNIIDMSHTNAPDGVDFDYCPANCSRNSTVTRLILSGSKLTRLPNRAFCSFPMLEQLALDSCHLQDISGSPFICLALLKNLSMSGNNITSLSNNNIKGLRSLVNLDLSNNGISTFQGSHILSTLASLRTLSLAHNLLGKLDLYLRSKTMIEELNIEGNHVKVWEPPLFSRMLRLRHLSFARNDFTLLDSQMLRDIRHVDNVDFSWNRWDCFACDLNNIQTLLQKHKPKCSNCFSCATPLQLYGQNVSNVPWREDDCGPPDYYRLYAVPGLLSFMIATLLINIAYRKRWYIMYGLLYLKVTIKGYRRQRNVGSFLWDGFLSYHVSDADWVRDVVLQRLESPPMRFRLCVAERDFIPGIEITENIFRAITQSRTSLFVISREFCRSRWCMFELSLAQHRLFESDRQKGLVLVKKKDVGEADMSPLLQYLTKTRTYVEIPPAGSSEALKNLFWLQLQAALER
ncbi:hypothetical protein MRX96_056563 [Rhipicephalus microplus]